MSEKSVTDHTKPLRDLLQGFSKPRPKNYWAPPAINLAEAALRQGPMIRMDGYFHSGKRPFTLSTIEALIRLGVAVQIGTGVVHRDHLPMVGRT